MKIPSITDKKWEEIVTGKRQYEYAFFPVKLLLT